MIEVHAFRSEALIEKLIADGELPEAADGSWEKWANERTIGRWEWVQLTYDGLRSAPEGEPIGGFDTYHDVWRFEGHELPFSDVILAAAPTESEASAIHPKADTERRR